jgi:pSer/pThr/pTyr-binding forkhead associated (FHA) protein
MAPATFGEIVVIKRDNSEGKSFEVTNQTLVFGRGQECEIRLNIPSVSRKHVELAVVNNRVRVSRVNSNSS